ncbi:unnamed protein product [Caenorhabditis bovis]|nr:unnamed protein product [Caenorhabditis bovis]
MKNSVCGEIVGENEVTNVQDYLAEKVAIEHSYSLEMMGKYYDCYATLTKVKANHLPEQINKSLRELPKKSEGTREPPKRKVWKIARYDVGSFKENSTALGCATQMFKDNMKCSVSVNGLPDSLLYQITGNERHDVRYWLLAHKYYGLNKLANAIHFLKKISHTNCRILSELGKFNYDLGRRDLARENLLAAFNANDRWIDRMDLLASLLDDRKYVSELQRLSDRLLKFYPDRPETIIAMGYMSKYIQDLDTHSTLQLASRALSIAEPGSDQYGQAIIFRVKCLRKQGRYVESVDYLREAIKADSRNPDFHAMLADLLLSNDEFREAKTVVNNFCHIHPTDVNAKLLKIHVYINVINRNKDVVSSVDVVKMMDDVLTAHPCFVESIINLLQEYFISNDPSKCERIMEKVKQNRHFVTHNKIAQYHNLFAVFEAKTHRPVHAYNHMTRALTLGAQIDSTQINALDNEMRNYGQPSFDIENSITPEELEKFKPGPSGESPYHFRSRGTTPKPK